MRIFAVEERVQKMGTKVYVGNLSWDVTDSQLEEHFSEAGEVKSADVITDRDSGRSRGFAFVDYETEEGAKKAIEMFDGKEIDGREVRVNEAREKKSR